MLTLTACEGGASSAGENGRRADSELLSQSLQLFKAASSVRVSADSAVAMGGRVDISVDRDDNCRVTAQNRVFHVAVERGGRTWMNWSDDLLDIGAVSPEGVQLKQELSGKWLELSPKGRIHRSMADLCALTAVRQLADQMATPGRRAVRDTEITEQGERLVPLRQGGQGNSVTVYVKADGTPYMRRLTVDMPTVAPQPVDFQFQGYGESVTVQPPKVTQTVRSARIEALAEKNLAAGLPGR
ncbi:hypothetical protein [Streptomyces sp. CBMA152]|uniref:hypothetical protein n=1 Tax=Streptomyces sp. CBMA152 TaxID=1896312 RepID=UPI0016604FFB|nr:hypothetical protein [Streptomyces sp. CBMA152]